jgi:hypothetical protein
MSPENLLAKKHDVYSQNGEDGVIDAIFQRIGTDSKTCCEFGAWDGVHLSNCRKLILEGWRGVMIEGDRERYKSLVATYATNPNVTCLNRFVDTSHNRLDNILNERGITSLDLLSVDIDGPDYELFADLSIRPRVICIEVSAAHHPANSALLPTEVSQDGVGQPLLAFTRLAGKKGYRLVCYSGNAFFVQQDVVSAFSLPSLSAQEAYEAFLGAIDAPLREWMYLVNLGLNPPFYNHSNPYLSRHSLGIPLPRAVLLRFSAQPRKLKRLVKKCGKWVLGR